MATARDLKADRLARIGPEEFFVFTQERPEVRLRADGERDIHWPRSEFFAWDPVARRKGWSIPEKFPVWSGAVSTAGDVVFYGTLDGWFKAVDAKTGKVLSKFKVGSGIVGNPITYRGPDGKQYVAVYAGIGGDWFLLAGDIRSDDPADVRPPSDPYKDIGRYTSQGGIVWIFGL